VDASQILTSFNTSIAEIDIALTTPCYLIPESLRANKDKFYTLAHTYPEIQTRLIHNMKYCSTNTMIRRAVRDHWFDFHLNDFNRQTRVVPPEDTKLMNKYFKAFNRIFFFGALTTDRYSYRLERNVPGIRGATSDVRLDHAGAVEHHSPKSIKCITALYKKPDTTDESLRLKGYVETLLHEMLHAFFNLFTCLCETCMGMTEKERREKTKTAGASGHGMPWHMVAQRIEEFVKSRLKCELDLDREWIMAQDIYESRMRVSKASVLFHFKELGMSYESIKQKVEKIRLDGESRKAD